MNWGLRIRTSAIIGILLLCPAIASAGDGEPSSGQGTGSQNQPVEAKGVGISGGAIAGAEIVIAVQAMFGVDKLWPYFTIPILGAAGGGVGGYFLEKNASPQASVGLLVGSMALFVPTILLATAATAYDPEDEGAVENKETGSGYSFDMAPTGQAEDGAATTEIESRPEGAPTDSVAPPPSGGPPAPAPEEEPAPESTDSSSIEPTDNDDTASNEAKLMRKKKEHELRMAQIRRATAGALFFIDNDGSAAITVPFVDIRPTAISSQDTLYTTKQGVEVMVPLLRIDLP